MRQKQKENHRFSFLDMPSAVLTLSQGVDDGDGVEGDSKNFGTMFSICANFPYLCITM
ncbi:MAG: hypothetical protein ACI31B_03435 [Muribaculaceae bacterium]